MNEEVVPLLPQLAVLFASTADAIRELCAPQCGTSAHQPPLVLQFSLKQPALLSHCRASEVGAAC